jgi:[acyl-carrier-protein] S-malonyltransferase
MTNHSLGIVFPGQGSQSIGMLADIAREFPIVEKIFFEASDILGYDLWALTQYGPAEELDKTAHTQPALLAASYAIWQILKTKKNLKPGILAGHSLGEYSALVCADAISYHDGIKLVAARGEFMQEAVPVGSSALGAIVGLDEDEIVSLCQKSALLDEVLAPANFNCPGQVVIAGHRQAVERALVLAKESGAKIAKLLPVSVSSHCVLMKPAAEKLAVMLASISIFKPAIPVISNVDVKVYENADRIRDGLVRQLYMPVRWTETIKQFIDHGVTQIIECGPGKVLNGLNKRIASDLQLTSAADAANLRSILETSVD